MTAELNVLYKILSDLHHLHLESVRDGACAEVLEITERAISCISAIVYGDPDDYPDVNGGADA